MSRWLPPAGGGYTGREIKPRESIFRRLRRCRSVDDVEDERPAKWEPLPFRPASSGPAGVGRAK